MTTLKADPAAHRDSRRLRFGCLTGIAAALLAAGCASYRPLPVAEVPFKNRVATQSADTLRVSVAALSPEESRQVFGVHLAKRNIQPVWLEIENSGEDAYRIFPIRMDPDYYSPAEVAYMKRFRFSPSTNKRMQAHFHSLAFPSIVAPGTTASGFIHTSMDPGLKYVDVSLVSFEEFRSFHFVVEVPGIKADYQEVDLDALYAPDDYVDCDENRLRSELERLPARTANKSGTRSGDPLNLVFIGTTEDLLAALAGGGWDVTEQMSSAAIWRTVRSSIFRSRYRHSPVSSLYVFDRRQDAAFQKARSTVDERNHLRIWLTRLRFRGQPVWIGQISRDIGVKLTLKTGFLTTHVIDPDVDHDRFYLLQNLIDAQALAGFGYVKGVGAATLDEPEHNLGGDPYYTDGLRAVLRCSDQPVELTAIELLNWEHPPATQPYFDRAQRSRSDTGN